jgi:hypothetical protein
MNAVLRRYWFEFEPISTPYPLNPGCGVTAYNYADAVSLMRDSVFGGGDTPKITRFLEDVDVSKLDAGHVIPNMGSVLVRGVWFPRC